MKRNPEQAWSPWTPDDREPWDRQRAAHLVRRAGFGVTPDELDRLVQQGYEATLAEWLDCKGREAFDAEMRPLERVLVSSQDPRGLASWWLTRMSRTPCQLLEKMTLFWHGHFATSAEKVANSRAMLDQIRLLREYALASFEPMVQGISRDVAMLVWLDSTDNRKTRPNENYARELMELFCLGPGNYTEKDIRELARCFTGWEVRRGEFRFNHNQHDTGTRTLLGSTGTFGGEEGVRIVLDHPAAPRFLARKLINWFCRDDVPEDSFCEPVAAQLRKTDFDIGAAVRQILSSRYFWSTACRGQRVRSPVELAIGLVRGLQVSVNMNDLRDRLAALGHLPLFPPNVKGWEGGRQWINASTLIGRINLVRELVAGNQREFQAGSLAAAAGVGSGDAPEEWVARLVEWQLPLAVPDGTMADWQELAAQTDRPLDARVASVLIAIAGSPEFQLC